MAQRVGVGLGELPSDFAHDGTAQHEQQNADADGDASGAVATQLADNASNVGALRVSGADGHCGERTSEQCALHEVFVLHMLGEPRNDCCQGMRPSYHVVTTGTLV